MLDNNKPTYSELEQRLAEADQILGALRRGEVDAVLSLDQPLLLRNRELEKQIIENERKYRSLYNSIRDAIMVADTERNIVGCNQAFTEMFGYEMEEIKGRQTHFVYENREHFLGTGKLIKERMGHSQFRLVINYKRKNGSIFPGETSVYYRKNDRGEIVGFMGLIRDITAKKATEAALKKSEELFRHSFENASNGVCLVSRNGRLLKVNQSMADFLGYSRQALEQMTVSELTHPEDQDVSPAFMRNSLEGREQSGIFDKRYFHKEGHIVWGRVSISLAKDQNGDPLYFVSHVVDITEQKKYQEAILHLATIVENSQDAIIGKDLAGTIISWNRAAEKIYGYTAKEALGKNVSMLVPPEKKSEFKNIMRHIRRGEVTQIHETIRRRKDGGFVYLSLSVSPVRDLNGVLTGASSIARSVAEIKQIRADKDSLEQQLNQAQKMEAVGILAGGIAHDFNNILAAIMGYVELSLQPDTSREETKANLDKVFQASQRAKQLIKQMLAFSRGAEHKKSHLDVGPVIKEALKLLRASIPSNIKVNPDIPSKPFRVYADPTQLHQILMNLCTNSLHALHEVEDEAEITVVLSKVEIKPGDAKRLFTMEPGPYVCLKVTDNGSGIPPSFIKRIFDPYFTTKSPEEGTGLGLAVVHGIVKNHGGHIEVDSCLGEGTEFRVFLPEDQKFQGRDSPQARSALPHGDGHILVVDDELLLVELNQRMLSHLGYRVSGFSDSRKALAAFAENPMEFDLLLTDFTMPDMSGIELMREIRKIRPDMPVAMCTGNGERLGRDWALQKGVDVFMYKPVISADLAQAVKSLIKTPVVKVALDPKDKS